MHIISISTMMSTFLSILLCLCAGVVLSFSSYGSPPMLTQDFQCKSYDYEYFLCNFTVPKSKLSQTTYKLFFRIKSQVYDCPLTFNMGVYYCNMTVKNNLYRQAHERYTFMLQSKSPFGTLEKKYRINHFDNVIPAKSKLKITKTTSNSVTYEWQVLKYPTYYAENGLEYETTVSPLNDQRTWKRISMEQLNVTSVNETAFRATISNLEYAYTWYVIRMRMKVKTAKNDGTMWSEMFNVTFCTDAKRPVDPPKTDIGSFHIDLMNNIHLYWEGLSEYKENGPDIQYVITEVKENGQVINVKPAEHSVISAKYNLTEAEYEFVIRTSNSLGLSDKGSIIRVPKKQLPKPQWLRKIYDQQIYNLSWTAPNVSSDLVDYTVFWCASKTESSDQCKGSIYFKHVSKETTHITHKEEGNSPLNFAVSANYAKFSSGMIWAMCTVLKTSDFGKIKPILSLNEATTIRIQWSLECIYSSIFEGYYLFYCPIKDYASRETECKEPERNVTIQKNATEYVIQNLKPFTTYKFIMSLYSLEKQGPPSDPVILATGEAAPSPPRTLRYTNLTSNSVTLIWNAPKSLNGQLRNYEIIYNNERIRVEADLLSNVTQITYTLGSLRSFYSYKVYVIARTIEDSEPSNDIHFTTLIGIPSVVEKVNYKADNSDIIFSWKPPAVPSGRVEFYEVRSVIFKDNILETEFISKVNGTQCRLHVPACPDSLRSFKFFVRAVNAVNKDEMDYYTFSKHDAKWQGGVFKSQVGPIHSHGQMGRANDDCQLIHNENRKRHNIQKREYTRNRDTSAEDKPSGHYAYYRLSLKCLEANDLELKSWLETHRTNLKFLHSEWQLLTIHTCNYTTMTKQTTVLICSILLATSVTIICVNYVYRKYQRMKKIMPIFPPGLEDLVQDSHKGVGNMKTSPDSQLIFPNILDPSRENDCSTRSGSVELSKISDSDNASLTKSINVKTCEKTLESVINPVIVNGYVQQQTLQKPLERAYNGYTTLDGFEKPIISAALPADINFEYTDLKPDGTSKKICGYVTHKQFLQF